MTTISCDSLKDTENEGTLSKAKHFTSMVTFKCSVPDTSNSKIVYDNDCTSGESTDNSTPNFRRTVPIRATRTITQSRRNLSEIEKIPIKPKKKAVFGPRNFVEIIKVESYKRYNIDTSLGIQTEDEEALCDCVIF